MNIFDASHALCMAGQGGGFFHHQPICIFFGQCPATQLTKPTDQSYRTKPERKMLTSQSSN